MSGPACSRALVFGLAVTGEAVARALRQRGVDVAICDDRIDDATRRRADGLGLDLIAADEALAKIADFDLLSPAPGVPEHHPVIAAAQAHRVEVVSEIELAYRWEQQRPSGPRPILAITGTDGKTTTTELTVAILNAHGLSTVAAGNTATPLVEAIDMNLDAFVVECTSFRLAWTHDFRAEAAAWLNLAEDHLNWHDSMASYVAAKSRLFDLQRPSDTAIGFVDDPVVMDHLDAAPGRHITFGRGTAAGTADYRVEQDDLAGPCLVGPAGVIAPIAAMRRALPHDITNALAASALVLESGLADVEAIQRALATFEAPEHRLEIVGARHGVTWYNDSKATTPHAAAVAIAAFDSLVLIAGGSDKGADLTPMGCAAAGRAHTVIAVGDTAPAIRAAFDGVAEVIDADTMLAAVRAARAAANDGDAVVLSPGCASFDWFDSYEHRGRVFKQIVEQEVLSGT